MNKEEIIELFSSDNPAAEAAQEILNKITEETNPGLRKHISIKVRQDDLESLKKEALKRGLRYQSLINSILHQYVTGRLKPIS